jgi:hypothetical protein
VSAFISALVQETLGLGLGFFREKSVTIEIIGFFRTHFSGPRSSKTPTLAGKIDLE